MRSTRLACGVVLGLVLTACGQGDQLQLKAWLGGVDSQLQLARRYSTGDGVTRAEKAAEKKADAVNSGAVDAEVVEG